MDSLLWLPPVLIGSPILATLGIALYIIKDEIDIAKWWRKRDPEPPLPKINQIDKYVEEYIWEQGRQPGYSPKRKVHHEDHMDWMLEYNALLSTMETAEFLKRYMSKDMRQVVAEAPIKGMPTAFRPETLEKSLLEQIQALTARYGFDHPRTQRVVKFHEERMNLHKRNWERWNKNGTDA
jgi:hypothetical protein